MNRYTYRRELGGAFKTWQYDYIEIEAKSFDHHESPKGYSLFTVTKL